MSEARFRGVSVVGVGKVTAVPDLAVADLQASAEASSSVAAVTRASDVMREMLAVAEAAGIAEADRRTRGMNLRSWRPDEGRPLRYQATNRITLRLRDVTTSGDVLQRVLAAGGDFAQLNHFRLVVEEPQPHRDAAREAAMVDARRRAELLARFADRELGAVVAVEEAGDRNGDPGRSRAGGAVMRTAAAGSPPVEAGEEEISATVHVEFEWAD